MSWNRAALGLGERGLEIPMHEAPVSGGWVGCCGLLLWMFGGQPASLVLAGLLVGICAGLAVIGLAARRNHRALRASHQIRRLETQVGCGAAACAVYHR